MDTGIRRAASTLFRPGGHREGGPIAFPIPILSDRIEKGIGGVICW
jgi:hypothetical protein